MPDMQMTRTEMTRTEMTRTEMTRTDTYSRLIAWLDEQGRPYRLIDHAPEGRTEVVSALRGHALRQAAKCLVLMVKRGKKVTCYVLAVVPGDARVDVQAVKTLLGGTYSAFASTDVAERLAGSGTGTILPFSFHPALELVVDPALLASEVIYFNAARLDRSMALRTADYLALAKPRLAPITAGQTVPADADVSPVSSSTARPADACPARPADACPARPADACPARPADACPAQCSRADEGQHP